MSFGQKIISPIAVYVKKLSIQTLIFIQTWHRRLGHLVYENIFCLPKVANGINVKRPIPDEIFGDWMKKRQQKKPSYELILQPSKYLDYIYCDLGGPYPTTRKGNQFYISVQDVATGAYYTVSMKIKSQTFDTFQKFIRQAERQPGKKLKHLRTDFKEEFANKAFEKYKSKEDVKWESNALYT